MGDIKSCKHSDSATVNRKLNLTEESDSEVNNENDATKNKTNDSKSASTFEKCKTSKKNESEKEINGKKISSATKNKLDEANGNGSATESVLRRRHLNNDQSKTEEQSDLDIESGVEITEEMTLSFYGPELETVPSNSDTSSVLPSEQNKLNSNTTSKAAKYLKIQLIKIKTIQEKFLELIKCYKLSIAFTVISSLPFFSTDTADFVKGFLFAFFLICLIVETFGLIRKRLAPIPRKNGYYYPGADRDDSELSSELPCNHKLRNIQRTLSTEPKLQTNQSDENDILEHKHVLSYNGWMNEIFKYDPTGYHSSMTKTVAVRLDGSMLRISSCAKSTPNKERVPRRAMWNEPFYNQQSVLDDENVSSTKKKVKNKHWKHINPALYSKHRFFELLKCRVELLPHGIAHKR